MFVHRPVLLLVPVVISLSLAVLYPAQETPPGRKYALLVGVNEYQHEKLRKLQYAVNDVREMGKVLRDHGYTVTVLSDETGKGDEKLQPTKDNIERELKAVMEKTKKGDLLLLAFTGHGLQFEDQKDCFFCPADARPFKNRSDSLLSMSKVYEQMEQSFAGMKVLLVDACRDDPSIQKGVKSGIDADNSPRPPQGVAALFSCCAGELSREHDKLKHGVFFYHVLQGLRGAAQDQDKEVTFANLVSYVNRRVPAWIAKEVGEGAKQSPHMKADYSTEPVLLRLDANVKKEPERAKAPFDAQKAKELQKAWADYLGRKVEEEVDLGGGVTMTLTLIPPGTFTMGSPRDGKDYIRKIFGENTVKWADQEIQHEVEISRPFYLAKYEVTQEQYEKLIGKNPSCFSAAGVGKESVKGENPKSFPVEMVSWEDAEEFCKALSRKTSKTVELPSEAQWEYACRAGMETPFHFGKVLNGAEANCDGTIPYGTATKGRYRKRTCKVGEYDANAWGLFDMHGNVWEWCRDYYGSYEGLISKNPLRIDKVDENRRVLRGGSWCDNATSCRSAYRYGDDPGYRLYLGFRVCFPLD